MNCKNRYQNRIQRSFIIIPVIVLVSLFIFGGCSKPKVYRTGILCGVSFLSPVTDGFKERMTELGYVEGKNIIYDEHTIEFDMAAYDQILKKFVEDKVDLILVFPTDAAILAKTITQGTGIPVVFTTAFTENTGLVNSVKEPGGNITGVRWPGPEIVNKGFEILMDLVPYAKRVWVPYQWIPIVDSQLKVLQKVALSANVTLLEVPVSSAAELETELQKQTGPFDADVISTIAEPLVVTPEGFIALARFAAKYSIPIGGASIFEGEYQSVFGLTPDLIAQGKQAAYLVNKIFKGTPAGTLPVLTTEYFFTFNYKQAEKLNLNITDSLLGQANKVIR